jgi:general secretion pathway protein E
VARQCSSRLPARRRARFHSRGRILKLDQIGYETADLEAIRHAIHAPDGLVVTVGPAGSGRRAALRAMADERESAPRSRRGAAILLETIAAADTAQLAIQAARSGHLVLSTMPLNRAVGAIAELRRLQVTDVQLLDALSLVIGHRLIARLCPQCSKPDARDTVRRALAAALNTWLAGHPVNLRRADPEGCPRCAHTGHLGSVLAYELIEIDVRARSLIASGAHPVELEPALLSGGRSIWERGLKRVAEGTISFDALCGAVRQPR